MVSKINNTESELPISRFEKRKEISLDFKDLTYGVPEGSVCHNKGFRTILKSVSGTFKPGCLTAVMGPSGAGKTTLLNILSGHIELEVLGDITVNGQPRKKKVFEKISSYITQEDRLQGHLTVLEAMTIASALKCAPSKDEVEKMDNVIKSLGLDGVRQNKTKTLSGGQKKRLAIGLELVNNPPVMFFDEPTSGLDSVTSYQVVTIMKSLATAGRTIVCTIHQPSARLFEMFDDLYILMGGQCIYSGSVQGLTPFMTSHGLICPNYHNPADFIIEVASGEFGADCTSQMIRTIAGRKRKESTMSTRHGLVSVEKRSDSAEQLSKYNCYTAPLIKQFWILLRRQLLTTWRDPMVTHLRIISHIVVGLLFGGLNYEIGNEGSKALQNVSFVFLSIIFLSFSALMPMVLAFPVDIEIMMREHRNRWYSCGAYFLGKTMADIPFQIGFDLLFIIIAYFVSGQVHNVWRFLMFTTILTLNSVAVQSMGLLIGAAAPSVEAATFIGPICCFPPLLLAGFFIKKDSLGSFQWLPKLSFAHYAFEGSIISLYGNVTKNVPRDPLQCSSDLSSSLPQNYTEMLSQNVTMKCEIPPCPFQDPVEIINYFDLEDDGLVVDCCALIAFSIGLRLLAYLALKIKIMLHTESIRSHIRHKLIGKKAAKMELHGNEVFLNDQTSPVRHRHFSEAKRSSLPGQDLIENNPPSSYLQTLL